MCFPRARPAQGHPSQRITQSLWKRFHAPKLIGPTALRCGRLTLVRGFRIEWKLGAHSFAIFE